MQPNIKNIKSNSWVSLQSTQPTKLYILETNPTIGFRHPVASLAQKMVVNNGFVDVIGPPRHFSYSSTASPAERPIATASRWVRQDTYRNLAFQNLTFLAMIGTQ